MQIKELDVSQIVRGTLGNRRIPTLEDALVVMPQCYSLVITISSRALLLSNKCLNLTFMFNRLVDIKFSPPSGS